MRRETVGHEADESRSRLEMVEVRLQSDERWCGLDGGRVDVWSCVPPDQEEKRGCSVTQAA